MLGWDFLLQILLLRTLLERPTLQRNISIFIQSQSTMSYVTCTYLGRLFPSFVSFKELLKFQQMKGTSWMLWLQRINFPHKYYICVNGAYRGRISKTNESSFNSTLANETLSSHQREFNKIKKKYFASLCCDQLIILWQDSAVKLDTFQQEAESGKYLNVLKLSFDCQECFNYLKTWKL